MLLNFKRLSNTNKSADQWTTSKTYCAIKNINKGQKDILDTYIKEQFCNFLTWNFHSMLHDLILTFISRSFLMVQVQTTLMSFPHILIFSHFNSSDLFLAKRRTEISPKWIFRSNHQRKEYICKQYSNKF